MAHSDAHTNPQKIKGRPQHLITKRTTAFECRLFVILPHMLVTPHVFMDTSVFDQNSHNYSSTAFNRLAELVKENKIKIYLTTITTREVEAHIKGEVESAHSDITAVLNRRRLLKNAQHPSLSAIVSGIDIQGISNDLLEKFRNWLSEMSVEIIPIEGLSIENVFDSYFSRRPPFGEKKKTEFPDAFTLAALERWCKEKTARMYVISSDDDMSLVCEESRALSSVKSVSQFLDLLTKGERLAEVASALFDAHSNSVVNELRKTIHMYSYWNHKPHERFVQSYIELISFPEKYLIEVDEGRAVFDVLVRATHVADVIIQNALLMTGIMGFPQTVRRDQYLKAEVAFLFDANDQSKFQLECAYVKEEAVSYYPQYSEYPDLYF